MYLLRLFRPEIPTLLPLRHSYSLSLYVAAAAAYLSLDRVITACYHHCTPTSAPGTLSDPSCRSNSDCVAMYCATVFWRRLTYSSIVKKPDSYLATAAKAYLHFPYVVLRGSFTVSRLDTWV